MELSGTSGEGGENPYVRKESPGMGEGVGSVCDFGVRGRVAPPRLTGDPGRARRGLCPGQHGQRLPCPLSVRRAGAQGGPGPWLERVCTFRDPLVPATPRAPRGRFISVSRVSLECETPPNPTPTAACLWHCPAS